MRNTYKSQEDRSFITCKATCLHPKAPSHSSFASLFRPVCLHNLFVLWKFPQVPCICHTVYSSVSCIFTLSSVSTLQFLEFTNKLPASNQISEKFEFINWGVSHVVPFIQRLQQLYQLVYRTHVSDQLIQKLDISQKFFSLLTLSSFVTIEQLIISRHLGSQHLQGREN